MVDEKNDDPLAWMLTMEMARQRGDFEQAAAAKRELVRLGVTVTYRRMKTADLSRANTDATGRGGTDAR